MLSKPSFVIVTMFVMGRKWLLGELQYFKTYIFKTFRFFSVRALIMKVQSNKKVYQSKPLSKCIFHSYDNFAFTSE